jgi:hypothetical protein
MNALSFVQCCHGQATILNDLSHEVSMAERTSRPVSSVLFEAAEQKILLYLASASEYLRRRSSCQDDIQRSQHDALEIYTNYFVVQTRRRQRFFGSGETMPTTEDKAFDLDLDTVQRCQAVLKAYCRLRAISTRASRLWLVVQATLFCARLVAGQVENNDDGPSSALVQQLRGSGRPILSLLSHPLLTSSLEQLREFAEQTPVVASCAGSTDSSSV